MARTDLRDALHGQVERSVEAGARLVAGGVVPERPGAWYPPTVLADVGPGMPAYSEELFGPVACIVPVADEAEAIRVANDTVFGLGASIYTTDVERGEVIAVRSNRRRQLLRERNRKVGPSPALRRHEGEWIRPRTELLGTP